MRDCWSYILWNVTRVFSCTRSGVKKDLEMIENGEISDEDMIKMWNKVKE